MNSGKYVVFSLGSEKFGLPIECVEQILTCRPIVRIPNTLQAVLGVFDYRGETLPVIDTRLLLGFPEGGFDWFIVVADKKIGIRAALVADRIDEILNLTESEIESGPGSTAGGGETNLGRRRDETIYLLKLGALMPGSSWHESSCCVPKPDAAV